MLKHRLCEGYTDGRRCRGRGRRLRRGGRHGTWRGRVVRFRRRAARHMEAHAQLEARAAVAEDEAQVAAHGMREEARNLQSQPVVAAVRLERGADFCGRQHAPRSHEADGYVHRARGACACIAAGQRHCGGAGRRARGGVAQADDGHVEKHLVEAIRITLRAV